MSNQPVSTTDSFRPHTLTEIGLWAIFLIGPFLGALKRLLPDAETWVTLTFDALCFGILIYAIIHYRLTYHRLPIIGMMIPILLFCIYSGLTIFNPNLTNFVRGAIGWRFLSSSFLLFFLGFYAFSHVQQLHRLLKVFALVSAIVAVYGIVQLLRGFTPTEQVWVDSLAATMRISNTGRFRLMSVTGSAVDLGFLLSLAIPCLAAQWLLPQKRKISTLVFLGLMATTLVFTYVRAAWAATFAAGCYITVLSAWQSRQLRLLLPTLSVFSLLLFFLLFSSVTQLANQLENPALRERIGSLADPFNDRSIIDRQNTWQVIWEVIEKYPYGLGVGMSGATSLRYPLDPGPAPTTLDNSYLKIIVETGWTGFVLFMMVVLGVLSGSITLTNRLRGEYKVLALALGSCFIAFLVVLFLGEYIELNPGRSLIWILIGLLFSLPRLQNGR